MLMLMVCTEISHLFFFPLGFPTWLLPPQNLKRVAEVWMDEYAEYIYQRRPEYRHLSAGDVTAQKELRNNLNCKSFKWFMSEVAWDLPKFYPPVEPPAAAWGEASLGSEVGSGQTGSKRFKDQHSHTVVLACSMKAVRQQFLLVQK